MQLYMPFFGLAPLFSEKHSNIKFLLQYPSTNTHKIAFLQNILMEFQINNYDYHKSDTRSRRIGYNKRNLIFYDNSIRYAV